MNTDNRKFVIIVFIIIVGLLYSMRLFYMQVVDESWVLRAQEIAEKRKEITPTSGMALGNPGEMASAEENWFGGRRSSCTKMWVAATGD